MAYEVAMEFQAPLDVIVVRKLGVPGQPDLVLGAVAARGAVVVDDTVAETHDLSEDEVERLTQAQQAELTQREERFRDRSGYPDADGVTAVLVDDGMASGATMRASAITLREEGAERLVVAVPVGSAQACRDIEDGVDEVVCLLTPERFGAVGAWYDDFTPVEDDDVVLVLDQARERPDQERGRRPRFGWS